MGSSHENVMQENDSHFFHFTFSYEIFIKNVHRKNEKF